MQDRITRRPVTFLHPFSLGGVEGERELETQLLTAPATCWPEAAEKARYLLKLLAATPIAQDPRRQKLIANVMKDFERLTRTDGGDSAKSHSDEPEETPHA
jgi:hypothetical protein